MATIDNNIYFRQKSADLVGAAQDGMRLSDMMKQRKVAQQEQDFAEAEKQSYVVDPSGKVSRDKAKLSDLAKLNPKKAYEMQTQEAAQQRTLDDQKFNDALKRVSVTGQLLASVTDQSTYDSAIGEAKRLGLPGVDQMPAQYEPNLVKSAYARTLSAKDQLELKMKELESQRKGQESDLGMKKTNAEIAKLNAEAAKVRRESSQTNGLGKEYKKEQYDAGGYAKRLEQSENIFGELSKGGYNRASIGQDLQDSWFYPGAAQGDNFKKQSQAERNFVNAVLRRESGAAISDDEFANAEQQYFPRAGDGPDVVAQKEANRRQVFESMRTAAGGAYEQIPTVGVQARPQQPQQRQQQAPAPKAHPQDQAAVQWAKANMSDPRAAAILQANGISMQAGR